MQLSISKLATILIALLIAVTIITTGIGLTTLRDDYRSLQSRQDSEAHDAVRNAALSIRNQILFYQGMLQRISTQPEVANLIEFGSTEEMSLWSDRLRRLLPGTLGAALASADGLVFGDPVTQRIGPACVADMKQLHKGLPISFPPLHTDVAGLEHFDLLTHVLGPSGEPLGTVFVSFRLTIIEELLQAMSARGDRFELTDSKGNVKLSTGPRRAANGASAYRVKIPDTSWRLVLYRDVPVGNDSLSSLIGADALILALFGLLIVFLVRGTLAGFKRDMARVHKAMSDVLEGHYRPSDEPTAVKETGILLPDIERLAVRLQDQRDELRHQSLSDALTEVFNRRYFDMMLAHLFEQSHRQQAAFLVIIDLNDFKRVNDEHGHPAGDLVLQDTARFLRDKVRATDIVARLGGDEFALILTHMARNTLDEWIQTLLADYDRRAIETAHGDHIHCRLSIGIAGIDAVTYKDAQAVFHAADRAMYEVKQQDGPHSRYAFAEAPLLSLVDTATSSAEPH